MSGFQLLLVLLVIATKYYTKLIIPLSVFVANQTKELDDARL